MKTGRQNLRAMSHTKTSMRKWYFSYQQLLK